MKVCIDKHDQLSSIYWRLGECQGCLSFYGLCSFVMSPAMTGLPRGNESNAIIFTYKHIHTYSPFLNFLKNMWFKSISYGCTYMHTRAHAHTHTHRIIHKPAIFMNIDWLMAFINHCHLIQSTKSIIAPPILMLLIINVHIIIIKPSCNDHYDYSITECTFFS